MTEAMDVADLVGLYGEATDPSEWRTAVHEAGHVLVFLLHGVDFERVEIISTATHAGRVVPPTRKLREGTSFEERLDIDVAGAVAEETIFGDIEPLGIEQDVRHALARSYVTDPEHLTVESEEGVQWVRAAVVRVRSLLGRRRRTLEKLARSTLDKRTLTRAECAAVVGRTVPQRPTKTPYVPLSELDDCIRAREYIDARNAEVRHGS